VSLNTFEKRQIEKLTREEALALLLELGNENEMLVARA
jgi:hypothetical protein